MVRRLGSSLLVLVFAVACSSKSDKGGLTPVSGSEVNPLAALIVAPPAAFDRSTESDAHNGALTPKQFGTYIGDASAATKTHLVRAYQTTYDSANNVDTSILVVLAELKSTADADKFKNLSRHRGLFEATRADPCRLSFAVSAECPAAR